MNHIELEMIIPEGEIREIVISLLTDEGFNGFEETPRSLKAYIPEEQFIQEHIQNVLNRYSIIPKIHRLPPINWNEKWERSLDPVIVDEFCTIRADFHAPVSATPHAVVITPKMSFGTGHHETTRLMIREMSKINFQGAAVLDFGSGTGVLAILAEKLAARSVQAVEIDADAYKNLLENIQHNQSQSIQAVHGGLPEVGAKKYDIILANINRNTLLDHLGSLFQMLNSTGILVVSGILDDDQRLLTTAAEEQGLSPIRVSSEGRWVCLSFRRE